MKAENKKNGMGAVIALAVAIVVVVVILTVVVVGVIKDSGASLKNEKTTLYTLAGVTNTTKEDKGYLDWDNTQQSEEYTENKLPGGVTNTQEEAGDVVTTPPTTKKSDEYDPIAEYEKLTKNGENILSDHHNNKYIKLVSDKYGADKELLVAIYSQPDTGNNFVLEFSGKRDEDGNVIKSPDTLTKVYSIDKNKNVSVATGKTTGNIGVSYAEGTLCFNMIKTIVMPQYPEYFTGVEK